MPARLRVAGQKQRQCTHEPEGAGLSRPADVYTLSSRRRKDQESSRYQSFSGQSCRGEPNRQRSHCDDGQGADREQHSVSHGVEDLTDARNLTEASSQIAIHPVGRTQGPEENSSGYPARLAIVKHEPQKERNTAQAHQGDCVGYGSDPVMSTGTAVPVLAATLVLAGWDPRSHRPILRAPSVEEASWPRRHLAWFAAIVGAEPSDTS